MAEKLKQVECDPKCGFLVRSHNEKELTDMVIQHAKNQHNKTLSEKDATAMIKDA